LPIESTLSLYLPSIGEMASNFFSFIHKDKLSLGIFKTLKAYTRHSIHLLPP